MNNGVNAPVLAVMIPTKKKKVGTTKAKVRIQPNKRKNNGGGLLGKRKGVPLTTSTDVRGLSPRHSEHDIHHPVNVESLHGGTSSSSG
jgi:hypothetical protein